MTTNQTIDGVLVSRELLERFVSDVEAHNYGFEGLDEVRALLDAPYPSEAQLIAAGLGYPMSKEDAVKAYKALLVPRTDNPNNADCEWCYGCGHDPYGEPCVGCCTPAAQPQGEPVAWSFKEYVWATGLGSYVWRDQLEADKPNEKEREVREVVPLCAEQPAPVAVMVPKSECPNCLGDSMFGCDSCIPDFSPGNGNKARRRAESLGLMIPAAPTAYDGFDNGVD